MSDTYWLILACFFFLVLLLSATRAALTHTRQQYLIEQREAHQKLVEQTFSLLEAPYFLTALRLGEIVADFGLAGMICVVLIDFYPAPILWWLILLYSLLAALLVISFSSLVEGLIMRAPEKWALRLSQTGALIYGAARPFVWLVKKIHPLNDDDLSPLGSVTDDELKSWVEGGQAKGSLEVEERKMIYSIFHLSDTLCREIMIPRIDVLALEASTDLHEAVQQITSRGHSRVPVYEEDIDNIIGILYAKDLLKVKLDCGEPGDIRSLLRATYFVPEAKKVDELLREMQERRVHLAVVIDEYGGMAGLVTLEDIVEEIVGEIRDEYDASEEKPYEQISEDEYIFNGRVDVDDVNEMLGTHMTREVADTIGGFILGEIGRVPVEGETVQLESWRMSVEQVLGRRIRRVRVIRNPATVEREEKSTDEIGK
ncbi:MAG: hemolysin family protein [Anaerolineae bacterium]|nr:hemolysin family protein [Anaerolineae bacterium]